MRRVLEVRDPTAEALWGIVVETLVDQRQSDPLDDEARITAAAKFINDARTVVIKSINDDQFLRLWVAGATPAKVAQLGWSWLVGWDLMAQTNLSAQQLGDLAREVDATVAEESTLPATVEALRDQWADVRGLDSDIRGALDDALRYAWESPANELGVAAGVVEATNLLDQRIALEQAVLNGLTSLSPQYGSASSSHWAARVAAVVLELSDAGREVLGERAGPISVKFTPTLGPDLEYRRDVKVGDIVGYDLPGLDPAQDKIREATTVVSVDSGQPTERVTVVVGTPDAPSTRTQTQTAKALRSINVIQRSK